MSAIAPPKGILRDFLTDPELAAELGIAVATLWRWRRLGKAPPSAVVGRRRITRREVVPDWLRSLEEDV